MPFLERGAGRWRGGVFVVIALVSGCSFWHEEIEKPSTLPAARMSPDTVVLEIFTLESPSDDGRLREEIWRQLDEQHLPPEVRLPLAANGVRCGRCGVQLPPPVFQLLDESNRAAIEANSYAQGAPGALVRRRLQSRAGRRGRIAMSGPHPHLETLWNEQGELRGESYEQATCVIAVRTFPLGDGRVRVELTPEIEHGPLKQRLAEGDGALRWEASQERRVYDALVMESLLAPGQTLILSATPSLAGLGRAFFVRETDRGPRPLYLVVRLAQTQHDDRFAPEQIASPVVTPAE